MTGSVDPLGERDQPGIGSSGLLTVASVANGLLAYALAVVASRGLDDVGFAGFGVAWSLWALSVAVLIFPLQHWVAWRVAEDGGIGGVRIAARRVAALVLTLIGVMGLLGSIDALFVAPGAWPAALAVVGLGSAVLGLGRGWLVAQGRFRSVAGVIGFENVARLAALVAVLALGGGAVAATASIAAGVVVLAPAMRRRTILPDGEPGKVHVLRELGAFAGAAAIAQVLVQFAPAAAELTDATPTEVGAIFSTFALTRAPVLVALALSTQLTNPLTRALIGGQLDLRRLSLRVGAAAVSFAAASGAIGWIAVPSIVEWLFGPGRALDPLDSALVTAGMALAVVGVGTVLVLLAARRTGMAAGIWAAALAVGGMGIVVGTSIPAAFATAEAVGVVGSLVGVERAGRSGTVRPTPQSDP